jgi:hypothetical protein
VREKDGIAKAIHTTKSGRDKRKNTQGGAGTNGQLDAIGKRVRGNDHALAEAKRICVIHRKND